LRHFSDVIVFATSEIVTKLTSQDFPFWAHPNQNYWPRQSTVLVWNQSTSLF